MKAERKAADWCIALLVPIGSIVICCMAWWEKEKYGKEFQMLLPPILLMINLATCYLYQKIRIYAGASMENELLRQQNAYFHASYEDYEKQWLALRMIRHNLANSLALEMDYLEKGQYEQLMEHYRKQLGEVKSREEFVYTGNMGIDSIVNYKLELAKKLQITISRTVQVADKVAVDNMDLNILIGNLMDNAIEAVKNISRDKKRIDLRIRTDETAFFLEVHNPFEGECIRKQDGDFLTSKEDKVYHGLGLKGVREIVRKYNGQMKIDAGEDEFNIKVLIYMDS